MNGCQNANECQYYSNNANNLPTQQVVSAAQSAFVDNSTYYNNTNNQNMNSNQYVYGGDSVVPVKSYDNQQNLANYENQNFAPQNSSSNQYDYYVENPTAINSNNMQSGYFIDNVQSYPPCQGPQPWNYAECYGYYGEAPCQFAAVGVDMEDFM